MKKIISFRFKYKNKERTIEVKVCKNIFNHMFGLMFRKKSKPLLFVFNRKKRRAIHSFFCVPFIAIWFNGKEIIEIKKIMPWKFSVKSKGKFDKLLEIPQNSVFFDKFSDEERNI